MTGKGFIHHVAVLMIGLGGLGCAVGQAMADDVDAQIEALRASLAKYQDFQVAVRDLYLSTVACVHYDGAKVDGHMEYPEGAMGVHFVNLTIQGPPDPAKPNVLLYEPVGDELKLVGAEWLVPLTADITERPSLFGQPFQGPMEGHEPLIPQGFVHYDLHVWLYKDNPLGMFTPTNPDVSCDGYDFALMENPTRIVPGP